MIMAKILLVLMELLKEIERRNSDLHFNFAFPGR